MKKTKRSMKKTKDYYPLINPDKIAGEAKVPLQSEEDIEDAKRWVDDIQK